jgi:hypothetical protein
VRKVRLAAISSHWPASEQSRGYSVRQKSEANPGVASGRDAATV